MHKMNHCFHQKSFQILNLFQFNGEAGLCALMKDPTPKLRSVLLLLFALIMFLNSSLMRKKNSSWKKKKKKNKEQIVFLDFATGI